MLAFVTGATGFVGSHVARALAEQGAELRLLVRATSDPRNIQDLRAERVIGDLRDPDSLDPAMAGCDVVFHVAADYRLWVRDPEQMYRSNVNGTRAVLEAARKNRVRRVVYTSSVATMGFTSNGRPADESSPVSLDHMIGHYKRSKFMAEQLAMEAGRSGMDVVVVNPTTPVGEQDIKPTPTGRIIVDFLKKKFPAYVDTGLNLVDVKECARGHIAALEKGNRGDRYILGGEVWPLVKQWSASEREFDGRQFRFFENARAVLVCGGIGAEAARRATEAIIRLYQPVAVESVGFAGALDSRLEVGTVIGVKR